MLRNLLLGFALFFFQGVHLLEGYSMNKKRTIEIIPLDSIEFSVLAYLKQNLTGVFHAEIDLAQPLPVPKHALNPEREQYSSEIILDFLSEIKKEKNKIILAVIDKDLYVPWLNFVFGMADPSQKVCIISLARLRQSYWHLPEDRTLFLERALKEAVHEIGHVLGLEHCPNPKCVMHFSNSLLDTDRKEWQFCPQCKKRLE